MNNKILTHYRCIYNNTSVPNNKSAEALLQRRMSMQDMQNNYNVFTRDEEHSVYLTGNKI